jgi:2'-5' RNA ligase
MRGALDSTMRLFFALWPPREAAESLYEWALRAQRAAGGRAVRSDAIHLTLAFLGEQTEARAGLAAAAAGKVEFFAHRLAVEQAVFWRRNGIVWVGPRELPAALAGLAAGLNRALGDAGFALEKRAFAAHVTLLRKARDGDLPPLPEVDWPVTEFLLMRSVLSSAGASYSQLARVCCTA